LPREVFAADTSSDNLQLTALQAKISTEVGGLTSMGGGVFVFKIHFKYSGQASRTFDVKLDKPPEWSVFLTTPGVYNPASYQSGQDPTPLPEVGIQQLFLNPGDDIPVDMVAWPPSKPLPDVQPYKIKLTATSGDVSSTLDLVADVSSTYGMAFIPLSGMLSTTVTAGQMALVNLKLDNIGTSPVDNIQFYSDKAVGWQIGTSIGDISSLAGHNSQVMTVIVLPPPNAMIGDYTISFWAYGAQTGAVADIRVTVNPPMTWVWIGGIICIVFIGGLFFIYSRFKRR
jgi:uncharacterized membrane protein